MMIFQILLRIILTIVIVHYGTNLFETVHCGAFEDWVNSDPTVQEERKAIADAKAKADLPYKVITILIVGFIFCSFLFTNPPDSIFYIK